MRYGAQNLGETERPAEVKEGSVFTNREQLVSGFNDLASNHPLDQSLLVNAKGQLRFAPLADDNLAASVMNGGPFQTLRKDDADAQFSTGNAQSESATDHNLLGDRMDFSSNELVRDSSGVGESMRTGKRGHHHHHHHQNHNGNNNRMNPEQHGDSQGDSSNRTYGVRQLLEDMGNLDSELAKHFSGAPDDGASSLTTALNLQDAMLKDPNLANNAGLYGTLLKLDKQLISQLNQTPDAEHLINQIVQSEQQALTNLGGGTSAPPVESQPLPLNDQPPTAPAPEPVLPFDPSPTFIPSPTPIPISIPTPTSAPENGSDMSPVFHRGDSGVSAAEFQHAIDIANALPQQMKKVLLADGGINMSLLSGFNGGAQGQNNGTAADVYADSGMADQAEVHELYEMYGQLSVGGLGSWSDSNAVAMSDAGMKAVGSSVYNEGDLSDTVGEFKGDGDHLSNAFTADFFASHPELNHDSSDFSTLQRTAQDDPALTAYVANVMGLMDVNA